MGFNHNRFICSAFEHRHRGADNDIRRGELRQVLEFHEDALSVMAGIVPTLYHAPEGTELVLFKNTLIPNGVSIRHRLQHGIQYHGISTAAVEHPLHGQQIV